MEGMTFKISFTTYLLCEFGQATTSLNFVFLIFKLRKETAPAPQGCCIQGDCLRNVFACTVSTYDW
jgi:hypothetical protein